MALLILFVFVVVIAAGIARGIQKKRARNPWKKDLSTAQTIGLAVSIVVAAFGLFVVGAMIFLTFALSAWADSK